MTGRILIASDGGGSSQELRRTIEFNGYDALETRSAVETIHECRSGAYGLLLMDLVVDGAAADTLCHAIRPEAKLGIIVLGNESGAAAIDVLNAGADDYVLSPYVAAEVTARVRALLRRVHGSSSRGPVQLRDRAIDLDSHEVHGPNGRVSRLTPKEFLVLEQLMASGPQASTRQHLARTIWQRDGEGDVEYMRIVIKQLRRKLEADPEQPRYILTERQVGYRLCLPEPFGVAALS